MELSKHRPPMNIPCPTGVDDWPGAKGGGVKDILSRIPDCEM